MCTVAHSLLLLTLTNPDNYSQILENQQGEMDPFREPVHPRNGSPLLHIGRTTHTTRVDAGTTSNVKKAQRFGGLCVSRTNLNQPGPFQMCTFVSASSPAPPSIEC